MASDLLSSVKLNPDRFSSLAELPSGLASLLRIVLIALHLFNRLLDSQYLVLAAEWATL